MKLKELYTQKNHKYLNLVLLLTDNDDFSYTNNVIVFTERKFYQNKESTVGYKFNKPISKILNEDL